MRTALQGGTSLTEITLVVAILGIVAVVAIPSISSYDSELLELAAEEMAEAVRFARSEAIRTGTLHGIHTQNTQLRIRVFRGDTVTTPPTPVYDVYHPVDKKLYDIDFRAHPFVTVDSFSAATSFSGTCNNPSYTVFEENGIPVCSDPMAVRLDQADLTLKKGNASITVTLHGITGRVTIQ